MTYFAAGCQPQNLASFCNFDLGSRLVVKEHGVPAPEASVNPEAHGSMRVRGFLGMKLAGPGTEGVMEVRDRVNGGRRCKRGRAKFPERLPDIVSPDNARGVMVLINTTPS